MPFYNLSWPQVSYLFWETVQDLILHCIPNVMSQQGVTETLAEVKEIMAVPTQIVSPQSNKPVMGIV